MGSTGWPINLRGSTATRTESESYDGSSAAPPVIQLDSDRSINRAGMETPRSDVMKRFAYYNNGQDCITVVNFLPSTPINYVVIANTRPHSHIFDDESCQLYQLWLTEYPSRVINNSEFKLIV
jgi:hypothetical protein